MKDNANWCEKTKRIVRERTHCVYAFQSAVCLQHGIKKASQVMRCPAVSDMVHPWLRMMLQLTFGPNLKTRKICDCLHERPMRRETAHTSSELHGWH